MGRGRVLPGDYFSTGVFRGARPGELLLRYTCLGCGRRLPSWAAFRAHRPGCSDVLLKDETGMTIGEHEATAPSLSLLSLLLEGVE